MIRSPDAPTFREKCGLELKRPSLRLSSMACRCRRDASRDRHSEATRPVGWRGGRCGGFLRHVSTGTDAIPSNEGIVSFTAGLLERFQIGCNHSIGEKRSNFKDLEHVLISWVDLITTCSQCAESEIRTTWGQRWREFRIPNSHYDSISFNRSGRS